MSVSHSWVSPVAMFVASGFFWWLMGFLFHLHSINIGVNFREGLKAGMSIFLGGWFLTGLVLWYISFAGL